MKSRIPKDLQFYKFSAYGFLKNLRFFNPYLFLFFVESGLTFLDIGLLFSIREIAVNLMEVPSGIIADGIGRRRAMIFSFLSYIVSFLLFFFFHGFWPAACAMVFFALGEAFRTGTHKAMILEYLKINDLLDLKVDYYGATRSWSQKGAALNALVAASLVLYSGSYRIVFLYSVIPYLMLLALMISYPKELDGEPAIDRGRAGFKAIITNFFQLLKDDRFRRGVLISSFGSASFKAVKDYIQPVLASFALMIPVLTGMVDEKRVALVTGVVYSILYFLTSYASKRSGSASRRFSSAASSMNSYYVVGGVMILLAGAAMAFGLSYAAVVLFVVFYMVENLRRPVSVAYVSDQVHDSIMATGLSGESQLKTLIVALISPAIGFTADRWGVGAAIALLGSLVLIVFPMIYIKKE